MIIKHWCDNFELTESYGQNELQGILKDIHSKLNNHILFILIANNLLRWWEEEKNKIYKSFCISI